MELIVFAGVYETRDGRRVTIYDTDGQGTFSVHGGIWKTFRGQMKPRGLYTWKRDGSFSAFSPHQLDLVKRISDR